MSRSGNDRSVRIEGRERDISRSLDLRAQGARRALCGRRGAEGRRSGQGGKTPTAGNVVAPAPNEGCDRAIALQIEPQAPLTGVCADFESADLV